MKYLLIISVFVLIIVLVGITITPKRLNNHLDFKMLYSYQEDYESLDEKLVKYLPDPRKELTHIKSLGLHFFMKDEEKGIVFQICFDIKNNDIAGLYNSFKEKAIFETSTIEKNLWINNRFNTYTLENIDSINEETLFPIPLFLNWSKPFLDSKVPEPLLEHVLPPLYTYFVLESAPISNKSISWQKNYDWGVANSSKWLHGYSLGVAVNVEERKACYWIDEW